MLVLAAGPLLHLRAALEAEQPRPLQRRSRKRRRKKVLHTVLVTHKTDANAIPTLPEKEESDEDMGFGLFD